MAIHVSPAEIPVLILFNLDPGWSSQDQAEAVRASSQLAAAISSAGHSTTLVSVSHSDLRAVLASYDPLDYVVLNWCESLPGVDHSEWLVADYLESCGFTFTGASSVSLALAQDKCLMKRRLDELGIPTPKWKLFHPATKIRWNRFPAIVKPALEHCSEGIDSSAVVMTATDLENRISYIREKFSQPALVEDFIDGREFHVSVWGNGNIDILPPVEMDFSYFGDIHDRICSYDAKFAPESIQYQKIGTVLPAPLYEEEFNNIAEICQAAYRASGCRDYARIDLRMREDIIYVLDVNPNSDISMDTSTASAAEYAGYTYREFVSRLVRLAARRHPVWGKGFDERNDSPD